MLNLCFTVEAFAQKKNSAKSAGLKHSPSKEVEAPALSTDLWLKDFKVALKDQMPADKNLPAVLETHFFRSRNIMKVGTCTLESPETKKDKAVVDEEIGALSQPGDYVMDLEETLNFRRAEKTHEVSLFCPKGFGKALYSEFNKLPPESRCEWLNNKAKEKADCFELVLQVKSLEELSYDKISHKVLQSKIGQGNKVILRKGKEILASEGEDFKSSSGTFENKMFIYRSYFALLMRNRKFAQSFRSTFEVAQRRNIRLETDDQVKAINFMLSGTRELQIQSLPALNWSKKEAEDFEDKIYPAMLGLILEAQEDMSL